MNQYTYFALGIVLGISLAVYYFMNREEKIESRIKLDQKIYSTKLLDITMLYDNVNIYNDNNNIAFNDIVVRGNKLVIICDIK